MLVSIEKEQRKDSTMKILAPVYADCVNFKRSPQRLHDQGSQSEPPLNCKKDDRWAKQTMGCLLESANSTVVQQTPRNIIHINWKE